jgi:hypothetical protein
LFPSTFRNQAQKAKLGKILDEMFYRRARDAVDSGVTAAQIFVDVYGLKTDKEFVNTLEDNIQEWGAIDKLISHCAKAEMSECVKQIL